jgi:hypothetical protein
MIIGMRAQGANNLHRKMGSRKMTHAKCSNKKKPRNNMPKIEKYSWLRVFELLLGIENPKKTSFVSKQ